MKYYDFSWNPFHGCDKCSEGCSNCWIFDNLKHQKRDSKPSVNERVLNNPPNAKGATIHACSNSDIFHPHFKDFEILELLTKLNHDNTWLMSTKRSERMREFFNGEEFPSLMMGVSIENQAHIQRAYDLLNTNANFFKRWLSIEPLIGEIDLKPILDSKRIDWVMIGCEQGENRRNCELDWVRKIVDECRIHEIKVFVNTLSINGEVTDDLDEFPQDLRIREYCWDRGVETTYVGKHGKIFRSEGIYQVESPPEVCGWFMSNPDCFGVELIKSETKKWSYKLKVKSLPPKPNGDVLKNYWFYLNKMEHGK